jgi:hypothetical protein
MFSKIRARFSSAHIMAAMALFIVLGGSAYAAKKVGTKKIKNAAVTTAKIADGAVTTPKLAANAVNGAKVDEASLGQVPSAASADKATTADSATTANSANSATTAETAANATNAADADDSDQLEGRTLQQVRGLADGDGSTAANGLPAAGQFEEVISEDMGIPTGGAALLVNSTVELVNNGAGQAGAQCVIRSEGTAISQTYNITLPSGFSGVIPITAFTSIPLGTAFNDPVDLEVFCLGSVAADQIVVDDADITVQRIPIGTGA